MSTPLLSTTLANRAPRFLIITDQTSFGRALEHHVSIIWSDAQCRMHAPKHSGRFHPSFAAMSYDCVLLDDRADQGAGLEWLDDLLARPEFPPIVYFASSDDEGRAEQSIARGALDCIARERVDHGKLAQALREAVRKRRDKPLTLRSDANAKFGGVTIPGHRFVREIAVGGTSLVYLAESERAGEMVVLKVLSEQPEEKRDHLHFMRFLKEYELISKIRHANVVRIFDMGIASDRAYIAMEYFPKGDLRGHITNGMRPQDALSNLGAMASALEQVHAVGVLHRDLKPGNVMVRADGSLALIDFGLAKHFGMAADITGVGEIFGTPYYMSPEQGHGRELDERSDLYSLGVIFYEMLTGKKPFVAPSPMTVIYLHANAPRPQLDEPLRAYQPVLDKLLAVDPRERYESARALLDSIESLEETAA